MATPKLQEGFTAVELIVALIVGVLLLGSAYQLYATVVNDAGDTQRRALASNTAYTLLRSYQENATYVGDPCSVKAATVVTIPNANDLPGAVAKISTACPYAGSDLNLVTVTIDYNNASTKEKATRAILIKAN